MRISQPVTKYVIEKHSYLKINKIENDDFNIHLIPKRNDNWNGRLIRKNFIFRFQQIYINAHIRKMFSSIWMRVTCLSNYTVKSIWNISKMLKQHCILTIFYIEQKCKGKMYKLTEKLYIYSLSILIMIFRTVISSKRNTINLKS